MKKIYVNFDATEPGEAPTTVILVKSEELEPLLKMNKVEVYYEDPIAVGARVLYVRKKNHTPGNSL